MLVWNQPLVPDNLEETEAESMARGTGFKGGQSDEHACDQFDEQQGNSSSSHHVRVRFGRSVDEHASLGDLID